MKYSSNTSRTSGSSSTIKIVALGLTDAVPLLRASSAVKRLNPRRAKLLIVQLSSRDVEVNGIHFAEMANRNRLQFGPGIQDGRRIEYAPGAQSCHRDQVCRAVRINPFAIDSIPSRGCVKQMKQNRPRGEVLL